MAGQRVVRKGLGGAIKQRSESGSRRDDLGAGTDFQALCTVDALVGCDVEMTLRILASGGSFGFVQKHLFNNLHHSETVTHANAKRRPYLWEWLLFIERSRYSKSITDS